MICTPFLSDVDTLLEVYNENVSHNSVILNCELPCFSPGLECALFSVSINNTNVAPTIINSTSIVSGSDTSYNQPTQLITLTNLTSNATYNYCVVAVNTTNMMEIVVGGPMCKNFTTMDDGGSAVKGMSFDRICYACKYHICYKIIINYYRVQPDG